VDLPTYLIKPLSRFYKREIDPKRAAKIYAEYDSKRGYGDYSELCRSKLKREIPALEGNALATSGFTYLNLITDTQANELKHEIKANKQLSYIKKQTRDLVGFHITDREQIREFITSIITAEADKQFLNYFQSEYLVHTVTFTITPKAQEQESVSFRWHCDKGPRKHLKMILYLNATEEHSGNTEFINMQDTTGVASRGYLFGWSMTRTGDIAHLSRIAGKPLQCHSQTMQAGDAVIFQPASVLHRGVSPTRGERFVITLCLLPSPIHWREALNSGSLTDLAMSEKWHQHASELLERFEQQAIQ